MCCPWSGFECLVVVDAYRTLLHVYITCLVRREVGRTLIVREQLQGSWKVSMDPLKLVLP
jgi:hypothetical protein